MTRTLSETRHYRRPFILLAKGHPGYYDEPCAAAQLGVNGANAQAPAAAQATSARADKFAWFLENTPNAEGDVISQVERYVVYPGQATAYMIGKLKIMELREKARAELGEKFDIKAFHDAVLLSGPVPLDVLEENVSAWVAKVKA